MGFAQNLTNAIARSVGQDQIAPSVWHKKSVPDRVVPQQDVFAKILRQTVKAFA